MNKLKCRDCGKLLRLIPSAKYRARMFGGKPSDYIRSVFGVTGYRCTACFVVYRSGQQRG